MNQYLLPLILIITVLSSCRRSDTEKSEDDRAALFQLLHGKYKVLSSTSSEAVDINMDGVVDTNLMVEINDLVNTHLELRIQTDFLFVQFWPEQYFSSQSEPTIFDPTIVTHYPIQGTARYFKIDDSKKQLNLLPDLSPIDPRFVRPNSIIIEPNNRIKVVTNKRLYTRAGWKTIQITTVYERYTMDT